jgi:large subunit ribosomal protein L3
MTVGILGTKLGMTQVFDSDGNAVPVTVVHAGPCTITQVKTDTKEGYKAIQVGYGKAREKLISKPELGHLKASGSDPVKHLREYRLDSVSDYTLGQTLDVSQFKDGDIVDVIGTSIGNGSKNHRQPGSTGAGTTPGRVYPGKRMAGRLGGKQITVKKLIVVKVDAANNVLLIKGAVPGKPGALLNIIPTVIIGKAKK